MQYIKPSVQGVADEELAVYIKQIYFNSFTDINNFENDFINQNEDFDSVFYNRDLETTNFTNVINEKNYIDQHGEHVYTYDDNITCTTSTVNSQMPLLEILQQQQQQQLEQALHHSLQQINYPSPTSSLYSSSSCDSDINEKLSRKRARDRDAAKSSRKKKRKLEEKTKAEEIELERKNNQLIIDQKTKENLIETLHSLLPTKISESVRGVFSDKEISTRLSAKEITQKVLLESLSYSETILLLINVLNTSKEK